MTTAESRALRVILAMTVDSETAAACLGARLDDVVNQWPSTVYQVLALTALESPLVWQRCKQRIDAVLESRCALLGARSPAELARMFLEGRSACSGLELAAVLWSLVRRRDGGIVDICQRLGAELETIAAYRLGEAGRDLRESYIGTGAGPG